MTGIYIHIPFCRQACHYCNFHFSTSLKMKDEMLQCLNRELQLHTLHIENNPAEMIISKEETIDTLYFGGGTPSILEITDMSKLIGSVRKYYHLSDMAEITLEANPDDINPQKLQEWKAIGINRLSVGIQSFRQEDLGWMNRAHDAGQAIRCLSQITDAGFDNYSIDLIFGIPGLTDDQWNQNIDKAFGSGAPHIACYALTVEPKTALDLMIRKGKKHDVSQDDQARQFRILMHRMRAAGYEHYETSNFALPGYRSKHNSSYWQQKKYLGIGPSAHSFDGTSRYWNISNNAMYIKALTENNPFVEKEQLTEAQRFNEYVMTSLRLAEGLSLSYVDDHFGEKYRSRLEMKLKKISNDWLLLSNDHIKLSDQGKLFTDSISVLLFE